MNNFKSISKKINSINIELNVNLPLVLFYLNYIIYGFYGANSGGSLSSQLLIGFLIIIIQIFFGYSSSLKYDFLKARININYKQILLFLGFFSTICIISINYLLNSLEGDEFSFLQTSVIHSLKTAHILINRYSIFDSIPFKFLLHIFSLIFLIFNFLFIKYTLKLSLIKRTLWVLILLFFFRSVILFIGGGNSSPHPPLALIPSFLSSSIFGTSSFFLKAVYQLGFIIFLLFVYRELINKINKFSALLIVIFIGTIPVLNRLSTTLSPSLFTFIIFSFLLIYFSFKKKLNYYLIFFLIAIGTMFRLPTLVIVVPTLILYLVYNHAKIRISKKLIILFSPLLITIPFLIKIFSQGTPATNYTNSSLGLFDKLLYAFESKVIYVSALNSIDLWSLFFFPFAFILSHRKENRIFNLIFFGLCLIVYYSIKIEIWGLAKYQVELFIPFIIIGLINLIIKINTTPIRSLSYILLIALIVLNLNSIHNYPSNKADWAARLNLSEVKSEKIRKESSGVIRPVYNIDSAYSYVKSSNFSSNLLSLNNDYGIMPEIVSGFSSKDIANIQKNNSFYESLVKHNKSIDLMEFLNDNNDIKILILGNWNNEQNKTFELLLKNNWRVDRSFSNIEHCTVTYVLARCSLENN